MASKVTQRLHQVKNIIVGQTQDPNALPWNPDSTSFALRKDLPKMPGAPDEAAWVWGKDDFRGRLNLLTPSRVKAAAAEIRTGETTRVDLPLDVPAQPAFGREVFKHTKKCLAPGVSYDDVYEMNTQAGTQWDGFRHFSHIATQTFYNGTKASDFDGELDTMKCSIHHWAQSGFSGRGVLLDYKSYAESQGIHYDSATQHEITYEDLKACGMHQGFDIRPESQGGDIKIGDILFIRSGWTKDYYARSASANKSLALRAGPDSHYAGVQQSDAVLTWLHDCYFAAVAGDAPAFEVWPPPRRQYYLHESIIALWGMPLGEMLDLEGVAELARRNGRCVFFFSCAPFNCPGGVSSFVNGTAIF